MATESKYRRKKITTFASLLSTAILLASNAEASINNFAEATNVAGKQRMLTQRMMMNYALIGQNITYQKPAQDQQKMVSMFEQHLQELIEFKANDQATSALKKVQSLWTQIKPKLTGTPLQEEAIALQKPLDQLLRHTHQVTLILSKKGKNQSGIEISTAGRQRMLSQRLASLYVLRSWRIEGLDYKREFKTALSEFKENQGKLKNSNQTTPEIRAQLKIADKAFVWFDMSQKTNSNSFIPSLILRSSNRILNAMDKATHLYAAK